MMGGSNTAKITALTRHSGTTEYIQLPGQLLSAEFVGNLEEKVGLLKLGEGDILYMDLYSNTIYMGSDEFGMPVPAFNSLAGTYHMTGCVETAPVVQPSQEPAASGREHHHHLGLATATLRQAAMLQ